MYDLKPQARPYAKAAFLAAVEEGQINEMFGDLKVLSEACSDSSINKLIESPEEKSQAEYNIGTLLSESQQWKPAVQHLRNALTYNPYDDEAKHNFEKALIIPVIFLMSLSV